MEKLPFFDEVDLATDFDAAGRDAADLEAADRDAADFEMADFEAADRDAADLEAADFEAAGFVLLVGYNTFLCSSIADWPEFAEGGGTMMSAMLQKQKGTCDLNIVLN